MPKRIQRKRTKGWRKPVGSVCIGRPSKWGNPFDWTVLAGIGCAHSFAKAWAVTQFRVAFQDPSRPLDMERACRFRWMREHIAELRSRDLVCWCRLSDPCHGDVLIEAANK